MANLAAAEAAATRVLLSQRLHSLRFDVAALRYRQPVIFDSMQSYCTKTRTTMQELAHSSDTRDGLTLRVQRGGREIFVVLYNAEIASPQRRNFTLAHEMGHICLAHQADTAPFEQEANAFAAQLLLPRVLVAELAARFGSPPPAEEVCAVFGASRQAAELRLRSLPFSPPPNDDDRHLLRRFGGLLPCYDGPIITV